MDILMELSYLFIYREYKKLIQSDLLNFKWSAMKFLKSYMSLPPRLYCMTLLKKREYTKQLENYSICSCTLKNAG